MIGRSQARRCAALAAALAALLAACGEGEPERITAVGFVTFNSPVAPVGTGLPAAAVTATRYGTVQVEGDGSYTLVSDDSVVVEAEFRNLETLAGSASYSVWARTAAGTAAVSGEYVQVRITLTNPQPGVIVEEVDTITGPVQASGFRGGPASDVHRFRARLTGAAAAGDEPYLVLSIEGGASPGSPGNARPLWFALPEPFDPAAPDGDVDEDAGIITSSSSGAASFGWFDLASPGSSRTFAARGTGLLSVRKVGSDFVEVVADLEELSLPPVGYTYGAWLTDADETTAANAGPVTSPPPDRTPLDDADMVALGGPAPAPIVLPTGILDARTQVSRDQVGSHIGTFARYIVTLEPKLGESGRAPGAVLAAAIPERVVNAAGQ